MLDSTLHSSSYRGQAVSALGHVGGITASMSGNAKIFDSHAEITASSVSMFGGITGEMDGGSITTSSAWVSGVNCSNAAGIAGYVTSGTITRSYSTGHFMGGNTLGGIAGFFENGMISDTYSTVSFESCYGFSAGLVGISGESFPMFHVNISNSYSAGYVGCQRYDGGFISEIDNTVIISSYYDIQTSNQTNSAGGEGKSTADMQKKSTFVGWDFISTWTIEEGQSYPKLAW
jgi:hypothetical protein